MSFLTETEVFPWVENLLNAHIVASERQGGRESGGRPGWFLTLEQGGDKRRIYVRGDRGGDFGFTGRYGLQREARILQVLHAEGIPVPAVLLSSEDPNAIILEHVDGRNDFTEIEDAGERDRVARHFAEVMANWHAIAAEKFVAAGLELPESFEDCMIKDLEVWEAAHFPLIVEPVPLVTFACSWLRRNLPPPPARPVLVQGDTGPGQFIFRDGRVQAVVDFELAHLGDPMRDLAHIRARDVWYPTGALPDWFRYYSEYSGTPLDEHKIRYYSVIAMLTTALCLAPVVQKLDPRDEHAEWIAQDVWSKLSTAEALGEVLGIDLDEPEIPTVRNSRASLPFDALEANLRDEQLPFVEDSFRAHRMRMFGRLLAHTRNLAEIGPEIDALERDDMAKLLGSRPSDVLQGTRDLDALVREAGPEMDETLVRYFYRHALREEALMKGGMGRAENARAAAIS